MLVMTPIANLELPDTHLIRALFDLSPAEAKVASGIAQGHSVENIAMAAGVSRETVRTQVKAVQMKTGAGRQSEIAALLAGLPKLPLK